MISTEHFYKDLMIRIDRELETQSEKEGSTKENILTKIMIDDLFHGFRKHRTHIALVRDNHNKIVGMVTMEDILEEIVSDIAEPHSQKRRKL